MKRFFKWLGIAFAALVLVVVGLSWGSRYFIGIHLDRCVDIARLDNRYLPTGLFLGAAQCVHEGRITEAVEMYALGGIYGRFDTKRVSDKSAHQAVSLALMMTVNALAPEEGNAFKKAISDAKGNPQRIATICRKIERLGPPSYYPLYMTSHGISNFTGDQQRQALVEGFDARVTWDELLDSYLHCPQQTGGNRQ